MCVSVVVIVVVCLAGTVFARFFCCVCVCVLLSRVCVCFSCSVCCAVCLRKADVCFVLCSLIFHNLLYRSAAAQSMFC